LAFVIRYNSGVHNFFVLVVDGLGGSNVADIGDKPDLAVLFDIIEKASARVLRMHTSVLIDLFGSVMLVLS